MKIEYYNEYSPSLGRHMELKVFGHAGKPILVFPSQCGRFYEYEGFGMIDVASGFIEEGRKRLSAPTGPATDCIVLNSILIMCAKKLFRGLWTLMPWAAITVPAA